IKNVHADGSRRDLCHLLDQSILTCLHERVLSLRLREILGCSLSIPHLSHFSDKSAQLRYGSSWRKAN
ncbi:hypothetical protein PFISCL1PPCAC_25123, partial [Pristionchus fissidentatus]